MYVFIWLEMIPSKNTLHLKIVKNFQKKQQNILIYDFFIYLYIN